MINLSGFEKIAISQKAVGAIAVGSLGALGGMWGNQLGQVGGVLSASKDMKEIAKIQKKDIGNTKEIIKKYAPDVKHITSSGELKKQKINFLAKGMIRKSIFESKTPNIFYLKKTKKRPPLIISKGNVNKGIIGHEIGHHNDFSDPGFKNKLRRFFRTEYKRETEAWKRSPIKDDSELKKYPLATYKKKAIGGAIGTTAGVGAGVLYGLKLLKKR